MSMEKEDLGLGLSLSFGSIGNIGNGDRNKRNRRSSVVLNLMPSLASSAPASQFTPSQKTSWNAPLPPADRNSETCRTGEARSFPRGIDVSTPPANACKEEAGVSSPSSTISSISGKRSERENIGGVDHNIDRSTPRGISNEDDVDASRKKLRLSKDQSAILEESFKVYSILYPKQRLA